MGKKNVLEIINKLNSIKTKLSDVAETNYGIITGNDNLLILTEDELKKLNFTKKFIREIIIPRDIGRYFLNKPKLYVIYPYIEKEDSTKIEELENIRSRDYNLYQYLVKNKSKLESRKDSRGDFKGSSRWYGLVRFSKLDIFNQNKIITPSIVKRNKFCLDNNFYAFSGGKVTCVTSKEDLLILLGILNSKLIEFYLHQTCPLKAGGYFNYSNTFLSRLPIRLPDENQTKKIKELVERRIKLKDENQIKNFDYEIDEEIYKLYGITDKEKEIIEEGQEMKSEKMGNEV